MSSKIDTTISVDRTFVHKYIVDMRDIIDTVKSLYETDEHQWMLDQISLLENKKYDSLDHKHLIEYLTEMSINNQREIESRFVVLLQHLLKCQMQPSKKSRSWINTIYTQQDEINFLLEAPSLQKYAPTLFTEAYPKAVKRAAAETRISIKQFPTICPWTVAEALSFDPNPDEE